MEKTEILTNRYVAANKISSLLQDLSDAIKHAYELGLNVELDIRYDNRMDGRKGYSFSSIVGEKTFISNLVNL